MPIIIVKFGGSGLKNEDSFNKILEILRIYEGFKIILVASAIRGVPERLLNIIKSLNKSDIEIKQDLKNIKKLHLEIISQLFEKESIYHHKVKDWIGLKISELTEILKEIKEFGLEDYYIDLVSSFGAILSTYLLCEYLQSKGLDSLYISSNNFLITDDKFNNAFPLYTLINSRVKTQIIPHLSKEKKLILCITGFFGRNKIGNITTLGEGGADYTATIIANSLHEVCEDKDIKVILWKDVEGLFAINPKYTLKSKLIKFINYSEAKQIANFGAKIIHPKCLEALENKRIPLEIRNINNPKEKVNYTLISENSDKDLIKGISVIEDAMIISINSGSMVDVPGVLARIFKTLEKRKISVSLVSQSASEINTSFVIKKKDASKALKALKETSFFNEFYEIKTEEVAIINITGLEVLKNNMRIHTFKVLEKLNVPVRAISQSFDEINISLVINKENLINTVKLIYKSIWEDSDVKD